MPSCLHNITIGELSARPYPQEGGRSFGVEPSDHHKSSNDFIEENIGGGRFFFLKKVDKKRLKSPHPDSLMYGRYSPVSFLFSSALNMI